MSPTLLLSELDDRLVITIQPSTRSWAVFIGCFACGFGMAMYTTECWFCKVLCVGVLLGVGLWFLDEWQEAVFDQSSRKFTINEMNFFQKYFCCCCPGRFTSHEFDEIKSVQVGAEGENKSMVIVTLLNNDSCRLYASYLECHVVVKKLQELIELSQRQKSSKTSSQQLATTSTPTASSESIIPSDFGPVDPTSSAGAVSAQSDETASAASSEESFERVSSNDLAEYEAELAADENDAMSEDRVSNHGQDDDPEELSSTSRQSSDNPSS